MGLGAVEDGARPGARALRFGLGASAVAALCSVLASSAPARAQPLAQASTPYNVVILLSDDQRATAVTPQFMPNVWRELVLEGRSFWNAFVPTPLCCPSRASILTGNYAHTTSVWTNHADEDGGFRAFHDRDTIATDFDRAGYRTAMVGKYLNGYRAGATRYVAPGWDRWFAVRSGAYYDYGATSNGKRRSYGSAPNDYVTRVLGRRAVRFVGGAVHDGAPFFLYLAFTAPHSPAVPDPLDVTRFEGETATAFRDNQLEAAYGVDRAVGRLLEVLPDHTIVVYLSDNGLLWGERKGDRGSLSGKQWPYRQSIRVPMILRSLDGRYVPAARPGDLVLNVDLRETLAAAADVTLSVDPDGIDWNAAAYASRERFPLEHRHSGGGREVPSYCGVRELGWMYVRFEDGTEELYREPDEVTDLADDPGHDADQARLRAAAENLCRPVPPGYEW